MKFVTPYKGTYYFVMLTAIFLSLSSTLSPYLLKITVDDYIRPKDYSGMLLFISLMLIALLLEVIFQFLFVFYANWLGQKVIKDLRQQLFEKILDSVEDSLTLRCIRLFHCYKIGYQRTISEIRKCVLFDYWDNNVHRRDYSILSVGILFLDNSRAFGIRNQLQSISRGVFGRKTTSK